MRKLREVVLTLAVGVSLAGSLDAQQFEELPTAKPATPATTATTGNKIGITNIQLAMARTQEGQKAREDMQAQFGPRQAELQKLQEEIRDLETQLRTQERTLSDEARLQLIRQIDQKRKEGTRKQEDLQEAMRDAEANYTRQIGERMQRIINQYAQENDLSVVLNAVYWFQGGPFVYAAPAVDITRDIILLYDQTYPVETTAKSDQGSGADSNPPPQPQRPN